MNSGGSGFGGNFTSTSTSTSFGPDGTKTTKTTTISNGQKKETIIKELNGKIIEKIVDGQTIDLRIENGSGGNSRRSKEFRGVAQPIPVHSFDDEVEVFEPDPVILEQLISMGVNKKDAEQALKETDNTSLNAALDWLINTDK